MSNSTTNHSLPVMRTNERMHSKLNSRPQSMIYLGCSSTVNNVTPEQPIQEQGPTQSKSTSSKTGNSFFTRIKNKLHTNKNQNQQQQQQQQNPSPLATCDGNGPVSCGKTQKFTPSK